MCEIVLAFCLTLHQMILHLNDTDKLRKTGSDRKITRRQQVLPQWYLCESSQKSLLYFMKWFIVGGRNNNVEAGNFVLLCIVQIQQHSLTTPAAIVIIMSAFQLSSSSCISWKQFYANLTLTLWSLLLADFWTCYFSVLLPGSMPLSIFNCPILVKPNSWHRSFQHDPWASSRT